MLNNKLVLVTGGAGLLGSAFCTAIVDNGGRVVIAEKNIDAANELQLRLGVNAFVIHLDITNPSSVADSILDIEKNCGRIDALVNNAYPRNANYGRHLESVDYEDFCENVSTHLGGYFLMMQKYSEYFVMRGGGSIINLASIYGVIAPKFEIYDGTDMTTPVEYAAIKSSIIHLTKYFAQYYKKKGIRVNTISPGGILDAQPESFLTEYNKRSGLAGMLQTNDLKGVLVFLLSDAASSITGQNIVVDDGFCL